MIESSDAPDRGPAAATIMLELTPAAAAERTTTVERLGSLWSTLQTRGFVHARPAELWQPRDEPRTLLWHVLFRSEASAATWREDPGVVEHHGEDFAALLTHAPETRLHVDLFRDEQPVCRCERSRGFLVQAADFASPCPVLCLSCKGRCVDTPPKGQRPSVEDWARTYEHVDRIWIDSGTLEGWSAAELSDPESALNRDGRAACRALEAVRLAPVYLLIRSYDVASSDLVERSDCPRCGGPGTPIGVEPRISACGPCRLAFHAPA